MIQKEKIVTSTKFNLKYQIKYDYATFKSKRFFKIIKFWNNLINACSFRVPLNISHSIELYNDTHTVCHCAFWPKQFQFFKKTM